jgi:hypothetical protein
VVRIAVPVPQMKLPAKHDEANLTAGIAADHRPPCPCSGGRMTFERIRAAIENCLVLAEIAGALVHDLADVDRIR